MKEQNNYFYDFAGFRLDPYKRILLYEGQDLQLKPKAFETLLFLVQRSDDIVSKEELLNSVWAETFVEENNLTQQISVLRKKFREFAGEEEFIVTMPKHGYKFVQPVKENFIESEKTIPAENSNSQIVSVKETASNHEKQNPLKTLVHFLFYTQMREITLGCILMVFVVWFSIHIETRRDFAKFANERKSIAVLEFEPLDGDARSALYSAGITRTLTAKIGNLETMILRPAGAPGRFYGQERDVIAIGSELQADIVLEGSVQNEGERVRIAVVAWDLKSKSQLWSDVLTKNSASVFTTQDEVSKEIIAAVQNRL